MDFFSFFFVLYVVYVFIGLRLVIVFNLFLFYSYGSFCLGIRIFCFFVEFCIFLGKVVWWVSGEVRGKYVYIGFS